MSATEPPPSHNQRIAAERRVLAAVANWRVRPDSPGALLRLMDDAGYWMSLSEDGDK
jgi:hypothetical protein